MKLGPATARLPCCPMSTKMFSNFQLGDEDQDDRGHADVDHGKVFSDNLSSSMMIIAAKIIQSVMELSGAFHVILHRSCSMFIVVHGKFAVTTQCIASECRRVQQ